MCGIFKWNVLLLSYTNKIEAVTLKQIKNKFNQSSVSTKQTKKQTKKNQLHKVLILMSHFIPILGVLIFIISKKIWFNIIDWEEIISWIKFITIRLVKIHFRFIYISCKHGIPQINWFLQLIWEKKRAQGLIRVQKDWPYQITTPLSWHKIYSVGLSIYTCIWPRFIYINPFYLLTNPVPFLE